MFHYCRALIPRVTEQPVRKRLCKPAGCSPELLITIFVLSELFSVIKKSGSSHVFVKEFLPNVLQTSIPPLFLFFVSCRHRCAEKRKDTYVQISVHSCVALRSSHTECLWNCGFLSSVIIQAYMCGREGPLLSLESSPSSFCHICWL